MAKAASERQRPAWDQAHSTTAATIGPTPAAAEQVRPPGSDQQGDGPGVVGDLGVQDLDAAGQGAQTGRGGRGLDIPGGPQPQPPTGGDELSGGQPLKSAAERVRSGDHEGVQLPLGVGAGLDCGSARGQSRLERRAMAGGAGLGELFAAQGLTGRPGGVQRVGLGAVAAGSSLGSVQLDHLLGLSLQEPGQASTVAASAFDRPDPLARLLVGQCQQLAVAGRGRRHRCLGDHCPGGDGHHRSGVGLLVGVDPNDELDEVCQHGHALTPCPETT
jgi:hypothetical protein